MFRGKEEQIGAADKAQIATLDTLFHKPESAAPAGGVVIHREFGLDKPHEADMLARYHAAEPGDEFHVAGYQAASYGTAPGYASSHGIIWHVHVPQGQPLVHIDGASHGAAGMATVYGERELLMNHGSGFRVLSSKMIGGKLHQDVELLREGELWAQ